MPDAASPTDTVPPSPRTASGLRTVPPARRDSTRCGKRPAFLIITEAQEDGAAKRTISRLRGSAHTKKEDVTVMKELFRRRLSVLALLLALAAFGPAGASAVDGDWARERAFLSEYAGLKEEPLTLASVEERLAQMAGELDAEGAKRPTRRLSLLDLALKAGGMARKINGNRRSKNY